MTFETFCLVNLLISFGELCLTLGVGLDVEGLGTWFVNWGLMGVARSFTAGDVRLICLTISGVMIGLGTGIWVDLDYLSFEIRKLMDFDTLLCFETLNSLSYFFSRLYNHSFLSERKKKLMFKLRKFQLNIILLIFSEYFIKP